MDFETTTQPKDLAAHEVGLGEAGSQLFFTREEVHIHQVNDHAGAQVASPGRSKKIPRRRRVLILAAGTCCLGLFVYGLNSGLKSNRSSGPTYRFSLPPAQSPSQSAALVKALPPPNLLKPLSPEQASQENAERPFVNRADTPASRFFLKTDAEDRTRALTCLAQAAYYEAAGEGVEGQRAVTQVVLNRVRHPGFPSTICGVVYEGADRGTGCQFSFACDGSMQRVPIPALWLRSKQIAEEALKGHVFAPVGHATHYHADYVLPYWADSLDKSVQIGRHIFYRLRSSLGDARAFSQRYGGNEPPFREPGAVVIPQTAETKELTDALIGENGQAASSAPRASPPPSSPLLADLHAGTLLAGGGSNSGHGTIAKSASRCAASDDHKQVSALKADDMRATLEGPSC